GAVLDHDVGAEHVHVHGAGRRLATAAGDRLHHHRRLGDTEPAAAVLGRHRHAQPALLRREVEERRRELTGLVDGAPVVEVEPLHRVVHGLPDGLLILGQVERDGAGRGGGHGFSKRPWPVCWTWLRVGLPSTSDAARPAAMRASTSIPVRIPARSSSTTMSSVAVLPVSPAWFCSTVAGSPPMPPSDASTQVAPASTAAQVLAIPPPRVSWKWATSSTPGNSRTARAV